MNDAKDELPSRLIDLKELARGRMESGAFDYYAGAAEDERTLAANRADFDRVEFRPRVLVDVSEIDTSIDLLGIRLPSPICIAPTAFQKLAHSDGEIATAAAAARRGHLMLASTMATTTVEDIAKQAGPLWLQLYVFKDRAISERLVRRAEAAGCTGICLTVDTPIQGKRERDARNRFRLPDGLSVANFEGSIQGDLIGTGGGSALDNFIHSQFDPSISWKDVAWLRSLTELPLILKGVAHPEDARIAVEEGVHGIVVSNHGGRQLDGAQSTIAALPDVVGAVQGRLPVLIDGGIRRGRHAAAALALGASAVLLGRPILWGLAAAGRAGVGHVLDVMDDELRRTMGLLGVTRVSDLSPDVLAPGRR